MASWRNRGLVAALAALVIAAAGAGCYRPSIVDSGLRCADGGVCPQGFHCAATGLCKKGPAVVCQASVPHVEEICAPDPGTDCDPICQSRCDCGRCNLTAAGLGCAPAGAKRRGEICNPTIDDCTPGNTCLRECGGLTARCYRICGNGATLRSDVCEGQECVIGAGSGITLCEPPVQVCNPVGTAGGCGHPDLGCYVSSSGATVCDCKGTGQSGQSCDVFNSCIPGYRCVRLGDNAPICLKTCTVGSMTDCSSGLCTPAGGGDFGYCAP